MIRVLEGQLWELLMNQRLAVLATLRHERSYCSLLAFFVTPDLRQLYFVASRHTRRFANLSDQTQVALLVVNRSGEDAD